MVINLRKNGLLFALLGSQQETRTILDLLDSKKGMITLTAEQYPIFAKFQNLDNPISIESVCDEKDCSRIKKDHPRRLPLVDLQEAFGSDVKIKSVTIETTNEDITSGIDKILPWLPQYKNKMLDGQRYNSINTSYPFANSLAAGSFSTEVK